MYMYFLLIIKCLLDGYTCVHVPYNNSNVFAYTHTHEYVVTHVNYLMSLRLVSRHVAHTSVWKYLKNETSKQPLYKH